MQDISSILAQTDGGREQFSELEEETMSDFEKNGVMKVHERSVFGTKIIYIDKSRTRLFLSSPSIFVNSTLKLIKLVSND